MKRGEVWIANLNPSRGADVGKIRPAIVMQPERLTAAGLPTVPVIPLTTQLRPELQPLRVLIRARGKLAHGCHAMVEQLRARPPPYRRRTAGDALARDEMAAIERSLLAVLGVQ